jgi:hypothetical protein
VVGVRGYTMFLQFLGESACVVPRMKRFSAMKLKDHDARFDSQLHPLHVAVS